MTNIFFRLEHVGIGSAITYFKLPKLPQKIQNLKSPRKKISEKRSVHSFQTVVFFVWIQTLLKLRRGLFTQEEIIFCLRSWCKIFSAPAWVFFMSSMNRAWNLFKGKHKTRPLRLGRCWRRCPPLHRALLLSWSPAYPSWLLEFLMDGKDDDEQPKIYPWPAVWLIFFVGLELFCFSCCLTKTWCWCLGNNLNFLYISLQTFDGPMVSG